MIQQVTYITISHRPTLKAFHNQILTIGDGKQGYTLEPIDHAKTDRSKITYNTSGANDGGAAAGAGASAGAESGGGNGAEVSAAATTTAAVTTTRGVPSAPQGKKTIKNRGTWQRLQRLVKLGLPGNSAVSSIGGIVAAICVQARLLVQLTSHGSAMMGAIFKQDKSAFLSNWITAVAISGVCAVMEQVSSHCQSNLNLALRTNLSKNFHTRLLANNNFYKISQIDGRITDSAQRIADDVRDFSSTASGIIAEFLKPVVELGLFAIKLRTLVGSFATSVLLGYLVGGAYIIRSVLPNFKKFVAQEAEADGKYMAVHARVKTHCESIAFFGGDSREKAIVTKEFDSVSALAFHRLKVSLSFGVVNQAIVRETPMLVQWLLRNEFGKRAGSDESVLADQGQSLNGNMLFIYEAVMCVTTLLPSSLHPLHFVFVCLRFLMECTDPPLDESY